MWRAVCLLIITFWGSMTFLQGRRVFGSDREIEQVPVEHVFREFFENGDFPVGVIIYQDRKEVGQGSILTRNSMGEGEPWDVRALGWADIQFGASPGDHTLNWDVVFSLDDMKEMVGFRADFRVKELGLDLEFEVEEDGVPSFEMRERGHVLADSSSGMFSMLLPAMLARQKAEAEQGLEDAIRARVQTMVLAGRPRDVYVVELRPSEDIQISMTIMKGGEFVGMSAGGGSLGGFEILSSAFDEATFAQIDAIDAEIREEQAALEAERRAKERSGDKRP